MQAQTRTSYCVVSKSSHDTKHSRGEVDLLAVALNGRDGEPRRAGRCRLVGARVGLLNACGRAVRCGRSEQTVDGSRRTGDELRRGESVSRKHQQKSRARHHCWTAETRDTREEAGTLQVVGVERRSRRLIEPPVRLTTGDDSGRLALANAHGYRQSRNSAETLARPCIEKLVSSRAMPMSVRPPRPRPALQPGNAECSVTSKGATRETLGALRGGRFFSARRDSRVEPDVGSGNAHDVSGRRAAVAAARAPQHVAHVVAASELALALPASARAESVAPVHVGLAGVGRWPRAAAHGTSRLGRRQQAGAIRAGTDAVAAGAGRAAVTVGGLVRPARLAAHAHGRAGPIVGHAVPRYFCPLAAGRVADRACGRADRGRDVSAATHLRLAVVRVQQGFVAERPGSTCLAWSAARVVANARHVSADTRIIAASGS